MTERDEPRSDDSAGLDELAEDMLDVLERMHEVSRGQQQLRGALVEGLTELGRAQRQQAVELDGLRRDLLGDHRARAHATAFDALHPAIDHIELVCASLDGHDDERRMALASTLSVLRRAVQTLGYRPFTPELGEPFDPTEMECLDYGDGDPGVVLAVLRPGYRANGMLARPCGVQIAEPIPARSEHESGEDHDE